MPRMPSTSRGQYIDRRCASAPVVLVLILASVTPAFAQGAGCDDFVGTLTERRSIIEKLSAVTNKKQVDVRSACSGFTSLVTNGNKAVKWLDANKDWCQIPDHLAENIRRDHKRASDLKGQACNAAAQQAAMEKKARAAQQQGSGGGLLGGDGLTGSFKMPQGAL